MTMRASEPLTRKGERHVSLITQATVRCLGRDGFSGTTLQDVADEAGLPKRAVTYYFSTREGLFDHVVSELGNLLVDRVEAATTALSDPREIVARGFESLWQAITSDRGLLVAWFGLLAESITNPALGVSVLEVTDRLRGLIARMVDQLLIRGYRLRIAREALEVVITAGISGLTIDYLERGETPGLRLAIDAFQAGLVEFVDTSSDPIER